MITKATVQVTVEIEASGSWDANCSMDQIIRQASESAVGQIRNSLHKYRIIGEPSVTTITNIADPWENRQAAKGGDK
ncbi:hypothetical protein [Agrobacterium tumefaciens]|uniref:hypothetical protein n=1 Tax=Agrobacterium tumefaciens TaxID=358 RepID=UPI001CC08540|nr:hypothetical protein [Agrobacterium tumefaciens]